MGDVHAVILAGGTGSRFGDDTFKQLLTINGQTVLEHSFSAFAMSESIDRILVVVNPLIRKRVQQILRKSRIGKPVTVLDGGRTRLHSSSIAVKHIGDDDRVLIHDAVRPFLSSALISKIVLTLREHDAVYPVVPATSTIVETLDGRTVNSIPVRRQMMIGQTPQGFKGAVIKRAYELLDMESPITESPMDDVTNDCALVQSLGLAEIQLIEGERQNVKITYAGDERLAPVYFQMRDELVNRLDSNTPIDVISNAGPRKG